MGNDLKVFDIYSRTNPKRVASFNSGIDSTYTISSNYNKVEADFEWLDMMEDTVRYIDNILRNPNRFIINEEEIVNVEQARRITVESIKHLSKHTNFIQEIEKNGDVKPSKILNINKDESFDTYENRVIYTLIQNMRGFIDLKKRNLITSSTMKDEKKCEYNATSKMNGENVNISVVLNSHSSSNDKSGVKDGVSATDRIDKLELHIRDLMGTAVYKALDKAHVARVIPPIKKTNLILKNTNFQYAMKLWAYLQENPPGDNKTIKDSKVYKDDVDMKNMLDDVFLLNYLAVDSISVNNEDVKDEKHYEAVEDLTNKMINKIVEINADLPVEQLEKYIGDKIAVIKSKREASIAELEAKFNGKIQSKLTKIGEFSFRA